jgi:hypothetical protein
MVSAISSSTSYSSPTDTSISTAALEAQIDRYQDELSNCVNCSSAKTLEGKEKIQSISNKISALKARIQEIENAKSNTQPAKLDVKTPAGTTANKDAASSAAQYGYSSATVPATGSKTATVGNRLDVFA